jgi:hypothetical protein
MGQDDYFAAYASQDSHQASGVIIMAVAQKDEIDIVAIQIQ